MALRKEDRAQAGGIDPAVGGRAAEAERPSMIALCMQRNGDDTMRKWTMIALALSTTSTAVQAQDRAAGQSNFALCQICHAVGEGAKQAWPGPQWPRWPPLRQRRGLRL